MSINGAGSLALSSRLFELFSSTKSIAKQLIFTENLKKTPKNESLLTNVKRVHLTCLF